VTAHDDLVRSIIPFFDSHPLFTSKYLDYRDWREAVMIMARGGHLIPGGKDRARIFSIKDNLNDERPFQERWDYCETLVGNREINIQWLIGFLEGEACFYFYLGVTKNGNVAQPSIEIKQSSHDLVVLKFIQEFIGGGVISPTVEKGSKEPLIGEYVTNVLKIKADKLLQLVIDMINNNKFLTTKYKEFYTWTRLVNLRNVRAYRDSEGWQLMQDLRLTLNWGGHKKMKAKKRKVK